MRAIDIAIQVAPTDLSVLITGESGVGKESFPQIIHQYSRRKHGQYIAVNCGLSPKERLIRNCSAMKRRFLPVLSANVKGILARLTAVPFFLMRWGASYTTQARLLQVLETGEFIKSVRLKLKKRMYVLLLLPM